ncbi:MAG: carnitine dehydratase [Deltaproteobacteria bacterium HGW-Deltaproteobacteria-12]|nr:MAG: carnitine dehydratase [Deltaproteobacteria bacterium HGW-Deltaproteobacteria-12]
MPRALQGLKVLDFTSLLPGPYATMIMADLGADVLRVIAGSRPDTTNFLPPYIPGTEMSAAAAYLGRGKRYLTLNLKDSRSGEIIRRLLQEYDIIIEQFRPGVMEKLGLDYLSLAKINERIIYCSLTGYGQNGPLRNRAGHDINYLARAGIMSYSGCKDTGPQLFGVQIADVSCGAQNAVISILAAVNYRRNTGRGQYLDVAMSDGALALHALFGAGFLVDGREPAREETVLNGGCLYDFYETADGRHLSFGPLEAAFFNLFCDAVGRPDWKAAGVAPDDGGRTKGELRSLFRTKTCDEWMDLFAGLDVCIEPVLTLSEVAADQQTQARRMIVEVPLPAGNTVRQFAHPVSYSETPAQYRFAGVAAGTHNGEVLRELGYTAEEIAEFEKTGLLN